MSLAETHTRCQRELTGHKAEPIIGHARLVAKHIGIRPGSPSSII